MRLVASEAHRPGRPSTRDLPVGVQTEANRAAAIKVLEETKPIGGGTRRGGYFTNDYLDAASTETQTQR